MTLPTMDLLPVNVNDVGILNGLVGIIIVTNSSRGHHFVYKYPREQQQQDQQPLYRPAVSKAKPDPHSGDIYQVTASVLGYDPQFLANVLSPKLALCDKRFQLTVEDLTFIGHPVSLTGQEFRQRRECWKRKNARPPKQHVKRGWIIGGKAPFMDDSDSDSDDNGEESTDEMDSARVKEGKETLARRGSKEESEIMTAARSFADTTGWRQHRFRSQTYTSNPVSPASGDSPLSGQISQQQTPSSAHQSGFAQSLLHHPVSMPQTPTGGIQGNLSSYLGGPPPIQISQGTTNLFRQSTSTSSIQHMSFFHIVFVLKPPELQLNSVADRVYKNIACKLTAALRYEELNSQYVSKEASKILSIREEAALAG